MMTLKSELKILKLVVISCGIVLRVVIEAAIMMLALGVLGWTCLF